jgi:hypothetical protein
MNEELKSMLAMGARLARGMGAADDEVAQAVGVPGDLDLRRQVAELHADIAELEIRMRRLEQVAPPSIIRRNGNGGPR